MKLVAVVTTVATLADAKRLAEMVVRRGLAACAQISAIESVFRWHGEVRTENECRIVFKTTAERYDDIERALLELHPYDLPEIHAVALDRVHAAYAAWVGEHGAGEPPTP